MQIKRLVVKGFRCLKDISISFEEDITVIVGENDSGKSSLVDCIKVLTHDKPVEIEDFNSDSDTMELSIEIENLIFAKCYSKGNTFSSNVPLTVKPTTSYLSNIKSEFESESFDLTRTENAEKVRTIAKLFGMSVRINSKVESLLDRIIKTINENIDNPDFKIDNAQFPQFNNIQLDGKHFENVGGFFEEVFLREKQVSIWQENVRKGTTLEDFVREKIDSYSQEISTKLAETGIIDKIKIFLPNLTDIRIDPTYQTRDLNIKAKVKFLENGREIDLQKKGDGTKRRITMALLELKKTQPSIAQSDDPTVYLLDEPDTHLHVKAQVELLQTLESFAQKGSQVILTTHSPFIINSVRPSKVRFLSLAPSGTRIKSLQDPDSPLEILQAIGIENVYLFFARILILVEGVTEEKFITRYFFRKNAKPIYSHLIRVINVEGIPNVPGFARGILELHNPANLFVVHDNDASEELKALISKLSLPPENHFVLGTKEFEDAFTDETLYQCWRSFHEDNGRTCPENWSVDNIRTLREQCLNDGSQKFSKGLKRLNTTGKAMKKQDFGNALANYIEEKELPSQLSDLFSRL